VIAILAILVAVAIPTFIGYTEREKGQVCNTNCLQLEKMYEGYLILEEIDHTEGSFYSIYKRMERILVQNMVISVMLMGRFNVEFILKGIMLKMMMTMEAFRFYDIDRL